MGATPGMDHRRVVHGAGVPGSRQIGMGDAMRLAAYNVENLFDRARVMNLDDRAKGDAVLRDFAALNALLGKLRYTDADRKRMAELMLALDLEEEDRGEFVILRRNRGGLLRRPRTGGIEVTAEGRADWVGSLELVEEPVTATAMQNTARVMAALGADVLAVVEAESRPALKAFNDGVLRGLGGAPFRHVMLIDGNDARGIDVGLMSREGYPIGPVRSHVDDLLPGGDPVFSRDCPDYLVETPSGGRLHVLVNHFKSKGGDQRTSNAKRRAQAQRVAEIYRALSEAGERHVAVIGDLNDTPDSAPLVPLLGGTELRDAFLHPDFRDGGFPGTFGLCNAKDKIDYLLLSPALHGLVRAGGVERRGLWPGSRPKRWETFPELKTPKDAASDHAAVWVDLDL